MMILCAWCDVRLPTDIPAHTKASHVLCSTCQHELFKGLAAHGLRNAFQQGIARAD